jgi:regulator of protease activity HflC (stomatin/prohibitin superfamily)
MLPWYSRKKISLRVRNVTGEKLKVNDKRGNPIEIAAVVVWRVTDTAQALFDVDEYQSFVDIQIETAVREIASHFSYDHAEADEPTLRGDADQVFSLLREKLQERVFGRRRRDRRDQALPPRLRTGNRQRHAAPSASRSRARRTPLHRAGRG